MNSSELGKLGERLAERHLAERGYRILDRNWRWRRGELDLVAMQAQEVVFVEVKARRSRAYGGPVESITSGKRTRLIRTAEAYLASTGRQGLDWRIDVVALDLGPEGELLHLEHIESAVEG